MDEKKTFAYALKTIRKSKGLSQEQLAELIDRSVESVSNMERGRSLPSYETLGRLSESLDVPLSSLGDWFKGAQPDAEREQLISILNQLFQHMPIELLRAVLSTVQTIDNEISGLLVRQNTKSDEG